MSTDAYSSKISGVIIKHLRTHADDRGFFREIIRDTDSFFSSATAAGGKSEPPLFQQWSHSKMAQHTIKAWHYHHRQIDWWYVGMGLLRVGLVDNRPESPTFNVSEDFLLGEGGSNDVLSAVVKIPMGVLHGCRVMSEEAHLFYVTSQVYDPKDEGRIPYNAPEVNFNWGNLEGVIVAPNDTKYFEPEYERMV
ncbi:MAG TPA: dTDP-4-dehydrorhamnose 3,5-epimerase family protein [Oligoflexia bacterium]|nr:dTDP-4-dehydrorhamnose 3,5-epimerase family protein [Oligoflexia bacterium]HMP48346.1 dTDP-4-dehydrorhamnose 3,5-epimerase family protein [Oligoflexia bacterium]